MKSVVQWLWLESGNEGYGSEMRAKVVESEAVPKAMAEALRQEIGSYGLLQHETL